MYVLFLLKRKITLKLNSTKMHWKPAMLLSLKSQRHFIDDGSGVCHGNNDLLVYDY